MKLSNRLTFTLIFSILLVTALAFVATPVMASGVEVTYTAVLTAATDADPSADPPVAGVDGKWEVTLVFTEGGSFSKNDFITGTGDTKVINVSLGGTAVAENAFSYASNKLTVPIPHADADNSPALAFTVTGYLEASMSVNVTTATAIEPVANSLRGKGYLLVVRVDGSGAPEPLPHLPSSVTVPSDRSNISALGTGFYLSYWSRACVMGRYAGFRKGI